MDTLNNQGCQDDLIHLTEGLFDPSETHKTTDMDS